MKIFSTEQIRKIDAFTIAHEPIPSVDLMERAAMNCAEWICNHLKKNTTVVFFVGPGNNGGDGWAMARILAQKGFKQIALYQLLTVGSISVNAEINRKRLIEQNIVEIHEIRSENDFPEIKNDVVVIDALFGSGLSRPLEGIPALLVGYINALGCRVISIDIPSGLPGEHSPVPTVNAVIKAAVTLTLQFPKRSFFYSENGQYTGHWYIIPIGLHQQMISKEKTAFFYVTKNDITGKIYKRQPFSHKGTYGRALLIAGSYGMMGAAILAARACLRTGVGLLTSHVPQYGYSVIQQSVPESTFSIDSSPEVFSDNLPVNEYSAVAAGPGIRTGLKTVTALRSLLKTCSVPLVLDADALNIISANKNLLSEIPEDTILTPHPGEFDRLFGKSENSQMRNELQIEVSKKYHVVIILKGAYTSVTVPDGRCFFNSTGNPGMATGGSGDVLTGMVLSLLAQGYNNEDAAIIAVFLHGYAGDIAAGLHGEQAMIASDIIDNIGHSFKTLEKYEATF